MCQRLYEWILRYSVLTFLLAKYIAAFQLKVNNDNFMSCVFENESACECQVCVCVSLSVCVCVFATEGVWVLPLAQHREAAASFSIRAKEEG